MSGEEKDLELEMILAKKRRELMMKLSMMQQAARQREEKPEDPVEVVKRILYDRGDEVLEAALSQYPEEARLVVEKLAELVKSGVFEGKLSGGQLLALFRQLGLDVRLESKILVEKDGKFVPLIDAVKEKLST